MFVTLLAFAIYLAFENRERSVKFWFCETCGKRVSEQDIDASRARNKKLKGVYCADCAAGVMTMEMLPISEEEARNILKNPPSPQGDKPKPQPCAPVKLERDFTSMATAKISDPDKPTVKANRLAVTKRSTNKPQKVLVIVGAGLAIAVLLFIPLFLTFGEKQKQPDALTPNTKTKELTMKFEPVVKTVREMELSTPTESTPSPDKLEKKSEPLKLGLLCDTQFERSALDPFWRVVGNDPCRIADSAWRIDTSSVKEQGAALVSVKSYETDHRYQLTVVGGMRGGTPNWSNFGQAWIIGAYSADKAQLDPDACPVVPAVLLSIQNTGVSVCRLNAEKLWSSVVLAKDGPPGTVEFSAVFQIDKESITVILNDKLLYRGPHGVSNLKAVHFINRGCNWKDPKGNEVWFRSIKVEAVPGEPEIRKP